ncbi:aminopeptidase N [Pleionea sediminis]|uniref:aminopeptidase N n=1 Tax=Pleionea sediminis TaxID=2569479 RepID=UPI0011856BE5|nr:aminopeptidase N [Pleionea sediminis]
MKTSTAPVTKYRKDYKPSNFLIDEISLNFLINDEETLVESRLMVRRNPEGDVNANSVWFDGEELKLLAIEFNGQVLDESEYTINEQGMQLNKVDDKFELFTRCSIEPHKNTSLEGLYQSGDKLCTQCEAEGFRKITYYMDRPDILAKFDVRIEADKDKYPLLLSNGNKVNAGDLANDRHFCEWQDPFLKPCYLFALVAGDLDLLEDTFTTQSGRTVKLELYVDKGKLDQTEFAMESLKNAMKWDEEKFNLEYDLDLYMIVAVGDFNMGAMENKGLNIFNTKYVLANPQTATDQDFENVESVIGHEYFHNWTGNRVTCRDWFQLSLKEGLTVFRDQRFTEDLRSKAVKRIDDVKVIRSYQFAEDAGPMAHPIRPDEYIEMNNFYTVTVYNKGAEVIRMIHTLIGEDSFRKGMDLYFDRHDGQAVTCNDFVAAMADASSVNLDTFKHWYSQAGTPTVKVTHRYDETNKTLELQFIQSNSHPSAKQAYLIPVKLGLIARDGDAVTFRLSPDGDPQDEVLLNFDQSGESFIFHDVEKDVVPSLFRDFSAPVKISSELTEKDLALLFAHDVNAFNRWDAGQQLMQRYLLSDDNGLATSIKSAFENILKDTDVDNAFKARALQIPDLKTLFELDYSKGIDFLVEKRRGLKSYIAKELATLWQEKYNELYVEGDDDLSQEAAANRALKNLTMQYLVHGESTASSYVEKQFNAAKLMSDEIAALTCAIHENTKEAGQLSDAFYKKWQDEPLVMDKWFVAHATHDHEDVVKTINQLRQSPAFNIKNPNKLRSLFGAFAAGNFAQFHRLDGLGYQLLGDVIYEVDDFNPQVAANLSKQFSVARHLDQSRQAMVKSILENLKNKEKLSKDVFEIVSKTLETLK